MLSSASVYKHAMVGWRRQADRNMMEGEVPLYVQENSSVYDGTRKTDYVHGNVTVTTHRIGWEKDEIYVCLPMAEVHEVRVEPASFMRSEKVTVRVPNEPGKPDKWYMFSCKNGTTQLVEAIQLSMSMEGWKANQISQNQPKRNVRQPPAKKEIRSGIAGIEKKMQAKIENDQQNINKAFQDLDRLMEMAKPMVQLANSIATKIKESQGEITEDETVQFKSYLMSLGIDNPVTKKSSGSDRKFYEGLAKEMARVLAQPLQETGGIMTLTDAFVRINRARGMELVSPVDVREATEVLNDLQLPIRKETLASGVVCILSSEITQSELLDKTVYLVEAFLSITSDQLASELNIPILMAVERLRSAVLEGRLVEDKSVSGIVYYPNKFRCEPVQ